MRVKQMAYTGMLYIVANFAMAQTPADTLVGTWVNDKSNVCDKIIIVVTAVEQNGIVGGTFFCERTGWNPIMGDKIEKNAVKATLTGTRFVMENLAGGGFDLTIDEKSVMKGSARARASGNAGQVTYVKVDHVQTAQSEAQDPLPRDKSAWKCSANGLTNSEYDGSGSAYIHLARYRTGGTYPVNLNEARTEATGTTADGTAFKCVRVK